MKIKFLLLFFLSTTVFSQEISYSWLEEQPKTFARDFYILQYLKQSATTKENAIDVLKLVNRMNNKLLFAYVNKLNHDESSAVIQCMQATGKQLVNSYADCIAAGLTLKKASKLDSLQLDTAINIVKSKYPKLSQQLQIINAARPFSKVIAAKNDIFYEIYLKTSRTFRSEKLNYRIPKRKLARIIKDKRIEKLIKLVVSNPKMTLAQKSFFEIDDSTMHPQTSFLLGLNLIIHNQEEKAYPYLDRAYKKFYFQSDKDKVIFWKYLISNDDSYLKKLLNSWDLNIYTLYAKDYFNKSYKSIIYDISQSNKKPFKTFDPQNQFDWIKVIRDTKTLDFKKIKHYETIFTKPITKPHITYLYAKYNRIKKHYFISPYDNFMKNIPNERKVLINAIARQESSFIPSSISTAYAQGVMQIMPFLSKSIAKSLDEKYDVFNMFKPEYSLRYANYHLNSLEERFEHPLFIAYAYNGGGGFLSSILKNGLFEKGQYEPFLSMERVPYAETREYGKKVLTNYIIYHNAKFRKKLNTITVLKRLEKPSMK